MNDREQFEAWFYSCYTSIKTNETADCWAAWQAAQPSVMLTDTEIANILATEFGVLKPHEMQMCSAVLAAALKAAEEELK